MNTPINADKPANVEKEAADVRIKLTFNNEQIIVKMMDNPTSRDFLDRLPLELSFSDYGGTEKISMLDTKLTNSKAPSGMDPFVGDFCYFEPWGNLAIFYKDFGYSNWLIRLGTIEAGIEKLANMKGDFEVRMEEI